MNRREMLAGITGLTAAIGITAKVEAVEAEPKPLLFVLTPGKPLSSDTHARIREVWRNLWKEQGEDGPKLLILQVGDRLEVVRPHFPAEALRTKKEAHS